MGLAQRTEGKVLVAKASDARVDARIAAALKQELLDMIGSGHLLIALDLSEVEFIDSSGLGALVSALRQMSGRGDMVIVGSRPPVAKLFRLTRMDKVFRMFAAPSDAVAALSN